jgi:hypothetical protein
MRYAAPVAADRVVDGFVLPLTYATSVDWLRNVLTAGEATITTSGETNHVVEPAVGHRQVRQTQTDEMTLTPGGSHRNGRRKRRVMDP